MILNKLFKTMVIAFFIIAITGSSCTKKDISRDDIVSIADQLNLDISEQQIQEIVESDSDNDGIIDIVDVCPDSKSNDVNDEGCTCSQLTIDDKNICTADICEKGEVINVPLTKMLGDEIVCPEDKCVDNKLLVYSDSAQAMCKNGVYKAPICALISNEYNSACSLKNSVSFSGSNSGGGSSFVQASTTTVEQTTTTQTQTTQDSTTTTTYEEEKRVVDTTTTTTQEETTTTRYNDDYEPEVPEFSTVAAFLVLIGAGLFVKKKRN